MSSEWQHQEQEQQQQQQQQQQFFAPDASAMQVVFVPAAFFATAPSFDAATAPAFLDAQSGEHEVEPSYSFVAEVAQWQPCAQEQQAGVSDQFQMPWFWAPAAQGSGHQCQQWWEPPTCYNSEATCSLDSACCAQEQAAAPCGACAPAPAEDCAGYWVEMAGEGFQPSEAQVAPGTARSRRPGKQQRRKAARRGERENPAPVVPLRVAGRAGAPQQRQQQKSEDQVPREPQAADAAGVGADFHAVVGSVARLSFEAAGCRMVQHALQEASLSEAVELASELRGRVREAVESPHANHVLQVIVNLLPVELRAFVSEELLGAGTAASRHRYGCRVVCRLLEHQPSVYATTGEAAAMALVDEVVAASPQLVRHEFGRHVVNSVLEHGSDEHRAQVSAILRSNLMGNAMNRSGSYVVEQALKFCSDEDCDAMLNQLLMQPDGLFTLARSQAGCHVVRAMLRSACGRREGIVEQLRELAPSIQDSKYGVALMSELGL